MHSSSEDDEAHIRKSPVAFNRSYRSNASINEETKKKETKKIDYRSHQHSRSFQAASPTSGHGHGRHSKEQRMSVCSTSISTGNLQRSSSSSRHNINVVKAQLTLDIDPITSNIPSSSRRKKKSSKASLAQSLSKLNNEVKERRSFSGTTQAAAPSKKLTYQEYAEAQLALNKAQQKEKKNKLDKRSLSYDSRSLHRSFDNTRTATHHDVIDKNKKKYSHGHLLVTTAHSSFDPPENLRHSSGPKPGTVSINADTQTSPSSVDLLDLESGVCVSTAELDSLHLLQKRFIEGGPDDSLHFGEVGLVGRSNKKNRGPRLVRQTAATIDCVHVNHQEEDCQICCGGVPHSDSRISCQHRKSSGSLRSTENPEITISFTAGGECSGVGKSDARHSERVPNIEEVTCNCAYSENELCRIHNRFAINQGITCDQAAGSVKRAGFNNERAGSFDSRMQPSRTEREQLSSYKSRSFDCHTTDPFCKTQDVSVSGDSGRQKKTREMEYSRQSSLNPHKDIKFRSKSFDIPDPRRNEPFVPDKNDIKSFESERCLYELATSKNRDKNVYCDEYTKPQRRSSDRENMNCRETLGKNLYLSPSKSASSTRLTSSSVQTRKNNDNNNINNNNNTSMQRQRANSGGNDVLSGTRKHSEPWKMATGSNSNLLHPGMISTQRHHRNRSKSMEDHAKVGDGLASMSRSFDERMYSTDKSGRDGSNQSHPTNQKQSVQNNLKPSNIKNERIMETRQVRMRRKSSDTSSDEDFSTRFDVQNDVNSQSDKSMKRQEIQRKRQCYTNSKQVREYGSEEWHPHNKQTHQSINDSFQSTTGGNTDFPIHSRSSFDDRILRKINPNDSCNTYLKCSNEKLDELRKKSRSFDGCNSLHPSSALDEAYTTSRNQRDFSSKDNQSGNKGNMQLLGRVKGQDEHLQNSQRHGPVHSRSFQDRPVNNDVVFNGKYPVYQSRSCEGQINSKKFSLQSNNSFQETQPFNSMDRPERCGKDKLFIKKYIPYMTRISHDSSVETSVDSNEYEYYIKPSYGKTRSFDERISREEQIHIDQCQKRSHSFSLQPTGDGYHCSAGNTGIVDPFRNYSRRSFDTGYLYPGRSDSSVNNNSSNDFRRKLANKLTFPAGGGVLLGPRKRHSYSNAEEYSRLRGSGSSRTSSSSQGDSSNSGEAVVYLDASGRRARSFDIYDAKIKKNIEMSCLATRGDFCVNSDGYLSVRKKYRDNLLEPSRSLSIDDDRAKVNSKNESSENEISSNSGRQETKHKQPTRQAAQDGDPLHHHNQLDQDIIIPERNYDNRYIANSEGDISKHQEPMNCGILTCHCYRRQSSPQKVYPLSDVPEMNPGMTGHDLKEKQISNSARRSYSDDSRNYSVDECGSLPNSEPTSKSCEYVLNNRHSQSKSYIMKGQSSGSLGNSSNDNIANKLENPRNYILGKKNQLTVCFNRMTKKSKSLDTTQSLDRKVPVAIARSKSPPAVRSLDRDILIYPSIEKSTSPDGSSGSSSMNSQRSRKQNRLEIETVPSPIIIISPCDDEMFRDGASVSNNEYSRDYVITPTPAVAEVEQQSQIDYGPGERVLGDNHVFAKTDRRKGGGVTNYEDKIRFPDRNEQSGTTPTYITKEDNRENCPEKSHEKARDERTPTSSKLAQSCLSHASSSSCVSASCPGGVGKGQRVVTKGGDDAISEWDDKRITTIASRDRLFNISRYEIESGYLEKHREEAEEEEEDEEEEEEEEDDENVMNYSKGRDGRHEESGGSDEEVDEKDLDSYFNQSSHQDDQTNQNYLPRSDETMDIYSLSDSFNQSMQPRSKENKRGLVSGNEKCTGNGKEESIRGNRNEKKNTLCIHGNAIFTCSSCHFSKSVDHNSIDRAKSSSRLNRNPISRALSCSHYENNATGNIDERNRESVEKGCLHLQNRYDKENDDDYEDDDVRSKEDSCGGGIERDKTCIDDCGAGVRSKTDLNVRPCTKTEHKRLAASTSEDNQQLCSNDGSCSAASSRGLKISGGNSFGGRGGSFSSFDDGGSGANQKRFSNLVRDGGRDADMKREERQYHRNSGAFKKERVDERRRKIKNVKRDDKRGDGDEDETVEEEEGKEKGKDEEDERGDVDKGGVRGLTSMMHGSPRLSSSPITRTYSAHCEGTCEAKEGERKAETGKRPVAYCCHGRDVDAAVNTITTINATTTTTSTSAVVGSAASSSSLLSYSPSSASTSYSRHLSLTTNASCVDDFKDDDDDEYGKEENRDRLLKDKEKIGCSFNQDNIYQRVSCRCGTSSNISKRDRNINHRRDEVEEEDDTNRFQDSLTGRGDDEDFDNGCKRKSKIKSSNVTSQRGYHHLFQPSSTSSLISSSSSSLSFQKVDDYKNEIIPHSHGDAVNRAGNQQPRVETNRSRFLSHQRLQGDAIFRQSSLPISGDVRDKKDGNSDVALLHHSNTDPDFSPFARKHSKAVGEANVRIGLDCDCMHKRDSRNSSGSQDFVYRGNYRAHSFSDSGVFRDNNSQLQHRRHTDSSNDKNCDAPVINVSGYRCISNNPKNIENQNIETDIRLKNGQDSSNLNRNINNSHNNNHNQQQKSKFNHTRGDHCGEISVHNRNESENRFLVNEDRDHKNPEFDNNDDDDNSNNKNNNRTDNEKGSDKSHSHRRHGGNGASLCVDEHGQTITDHTHTLDENRQNNNILHSTHRANLCRNTHPNNSNTSSPYLQPSSSSSPTSHHRHYIGQNGCLRSRSADISLYTKNEEVGGHDNAYESIRLRAHAPHQSHSFDEIAHINKTRNTNNRNNSITYCNSWINDNSNEFGLSCNAGNTNSIDNNVCCHHHHHHHQHHHHNHHHHQNQHQTPQQQQQKLDTRSNSFDFERAKRCGKFTQAIKADVHAGGSTAFSSSNDNSSSNNNIQTSNEIGSFSSRDTVIYQPTNDILADNSNHSSSSLLDVSFSLIHESTSVGEKEEEEEKEKEDHDDDDEKSDSEEFVLEATPLLSRPMAGACPDGRGIEIIVSDENDARVSTVQTGKGAIFRRIWLVLLDNRMAGRPDAESAIQPQPDEYRLLKKTLNILFIVVGIALLVSVFVVIAYTYAVDPDDQRDITGRRTMNSHDGDNVKGKPPIITLTNVTESTTTQ